MTISPAKNDPAGQVGDVDRSPEARQLAQAGPPIDHREDGQSGMLGKQLRPPQDDEDIPDRIGSRHQKFDHRPGKYLPSLGEHHRHEQHAEPQVQPGGKTGDQQSGGSALDFGQPLGDLLLQDAPSRFARLAHILTRRLFSALRLIQICIGQRYSYLPASLIMPESTPFRRLA
jgi:hypothetical protein